MTETLKVPKVSFKRIKKMCNNVHSQMTKFIGQTLIADTFHEFTSVLHEALPNGILHETVQQSLLDLLGVVITDRQLMELCWRLSANIERLRECESVPKWQKQTKAEWALCQIAKVKYNADQSPPSIRITFRVLTGEAATEDLYQQWSTKKAKYLASYRDDAGYGFGFGRSRINKRGEQKGHLLFSKFAQYQQLRCFLLLQPTRNNDDLTATEIKHTSSTMQYNKRWLSLRDREYSTCLLNLQGNPDCVDCRLGRDKCSLALRKISLSDR